MSILDEPRFVSHESFRREPPAGADPKSIEAQIKAFFSKGGAVQVIPDGVTATKIVGIKELSAIKAAQILGGQRGSKARAAKYQAQKSKIRFEE
jgi:hypothetical protein